MKIVLISGLSGSGKSVALRQMEDSGYFCVDNLPLEMLPALVSYHIERADETELAVSVDVRSGIDIGQAREQIASLRGLGTGLKFCLSRRKKACWSAGFPKPGEDIL